MGPKDAPCEHPSPAKTSAPAPSAFIFPPRRSHFPRMAFGLPPNDVRPCRSNVHTSAPSFTLPPHTLRRRPRRLRPPAAAVIHNGLSTEKLSTSFLPTLCKTFSPSRLRTRIYNISFARRPLPGVSAPLWGRGRAVVTPCPAPACAGWGRAKAKAEAPSRSAPHFPRLRPRPCQLMGEVPSAKAEVHKVIPAPARAYSPRQLVYGRAPARLCPNHCAQRRKCTRQSSPLPVRTPRDSLPTAAPPPLVCRIAERKGGVHKAIPAPARASFPRELVYGRALCPLMGEVPSAGWGRAKAKADAPSRSAPYLPAYRPASAA